jgi:hypothetical protein
LALTWDRTKQWYSFVASPRGPHVHILATLIKSAAGVDLAGKVARTGIKKGTAGPTGPAVPLFVGKLSRS